MRFDLGPAECAEAVLIRFARGFRISVSASSFNTAGPAGGWPYSIAPRIPLGLRIFGQKWQQNRPRIAKYCKMQGK